MRQPTCETFAAHLTGRAELSRLADRPDPDLWREAVTTWDGIGFPYAAAYARFRGAEAVLAAGGDRDRVAAELRSSHDAATTLRARAADGGDRAPGPPGRDSTWVPAPPPVTARPRAMAPGPS